ncbi:MAG: LacI family DNA-binding transcriptional regulator [Proteobacteria bacterium]|nr:LacI family DNA-binding transcriptional regulator [Pseudomonadota bacterium]
MIQRATPRVTILDVAREAGVSATTVSHALNGRGQVDARTRAKVELTARRLGYRPNRHAQRLRTGEAHMIALVSSMPFAVAGGPSRLGFLMEIAAVAAGAALTHGLALALLPPVEGGKIAIDTIDVDGALVVEPTARDATIDTLRKRGVPVVAIGKPPGARPRVPSIDLRSTETAELLLGHLAEVGARRIALLVGSEKRNSYAETIAVYERLAEAREMPLRMAQIDEADGEEGGRRAMAELLAARPDIDGVCALVDAFAVGAARAIVETGRRIPDDVRLVTRYDGVRARMHVPPLTSVDLGLEQVATQATDLLFACLGGEVKEDVILGPAPRLVVRASSARA